MDNKEIIEKFYKLHLLIKEKNGVLAAALAKATIPLIEYEPSLQTVSREELLKIKGIGNATVDFIIRIRDGEHIYGIAGTVPIPKKRPRWAMGLK